MLDHPMHPEPRPCPERRRAGRPTRSIGRATATWRRLTSRSPANRYSPIVRVTLISSHHGETLDVLRNPNVWPSHREDIEVRDLSPARGFCGDLKCSRGVESDRRGSGVERGQREHQGSFRGYPQKDVVRCSLDSCLLLSSFFA